MRRSDYEITDRAALDEIIRRHSVLYLALQDGDGAPYVIPMTYGYDGECLYLHAAPEGRKLDLLRRQPRVGFAIEAEYEVKAGGVACAWGFGYTSVVGEGEGQILEDRKEKQNGLDVLMSHFTDESPTYKEEAIEKTTVVRVRITSVSGKRHA